MKHYRPFARIMAIAIASTMMTACSLDSYEPEKPFTTDPVGKAHLWCIGQPGTRSVADVEKLLFTDDDIEWFDPDTRELRFRDMEEPLYEKLRLLSSVEFRLGNQTLFSGSTFVGLICSQVFNDLVLCCGKIEDGRVIDSNRYYLYDCYPNTPQFLNDEQVKANRAKRAAQWETFTKYLESKGKLKK
ncbi:MAG: hypothetical protein IKH37_08985 [Prevotella sp.]|nr:hypothetical protein [Prevotella sp.]